MEKNLITRYAIMNMNHCCFIDEAGEDVPSFEKAIKFEDKDEAYDFLKTKSERLRNTCIIYKAEIDTTFTLIEYGKNLKNTHIFCDSVTGQNVDIEGYTIKEMPKEPPHLPTKTICDVPFGGKKGEE